MACAARLSSPLLSPLREQRGTGPGHAWHSRFPVPAGWCHPQSRAVVCPDGGLLGHSLGKGVPPGETARTTAPRVIFRFGPLRFAGGQLEELWHFLSPRPAHLGPSRELNCIARRYTAKTERATRPTGQRAKGPTCQERALHSLALPGIRRPFCRPTGTPPAKVRGRRHGSTPELVSISFFRNGVLT